ncbi:UPF0481 protein At3g47200-like [Argentina anserina]|uniref:UPF0481 protein At3g47200-like n=1 Tax=Argentina anserina TaxID=57926 RepID=UPI00217676E3|nr:UPF0481 protein At3g47200-like [Potentilla anserina]
MSNKPSPAKKMRYPKCKKVKPEDEQARTGGGNVVSPTPKTDPSLAAKERAKERAREKELAEAQIHNSEIAKILRLSLLDKVFIRFRRPGDYHFTAGLDVTVGQESQHTTIYIDDSNNCIFRVPKVLQKQNPDAYTPYVVSIGPFHRRMETKVQRKDDKKKGKKKGKDGSNDKDYQYIQLIKRMKERYLNEVLSYMHMTDRTELIKKVVEISGPRYDAPNQFEKRARNFYAEQLDYNSNDFIEMMVVDGCFLIQLFRKCNDEQLRGCYDPLFSMEYMFHFLCHDLLLLENQLPWFVLETIYGLILEYSQCRSTLLSVLVLDAFKELPSLKHCQSYKDHLLQYHPHRRNWRGPDNANFLHILDLMRDTIVLPHLNGDQTESKQQKLDPDVHEMHSATTLSKAGIAFKGIQSKTGIMDIHFKKSWFPYALIFNGVLNIPKLHVGMLSESLFRNLIAFEQCYDGIPNKVTSYAVFMDNLISTQEDMDLLCKAEVIGNWLGDEEGCKFFNNLYKGIPHSKFYYHDLCKELQDRYKIPWYTHVASFKTQKLSNPWAVIAFCTALVLLTLQLWNSTNSLRSFRKQNNGF